MSVWVLRDKWWGPVPKASGPAVIVSIPHICLKKKNPQHSKRKSARFSWTPIPVPKVSGQTVIISMPQGQAFHRTGEIEKSDKQKIYSENDI